MRPALFLIMLFLAASSATAALGSGDAAMTIGASVKSAPVGPYAYYREDPSGSLTLDRVIERRVSEPFTRNQKAVPAWGFTRSAFWLRFTFVAEAGAPRDWVLELAYPLMDFIELYVPDERGSYRRIDAGYHYPFPHRGNGYPSFVFPLTVTPGTRSTVYLRLASGDRVEAPLTLWQADAFHEKTINETYVLGMYYGLILVIIILNLIFFMSVRDRAYLYYVFFAIALALFQLTQNGFAYKFLPTWITPFNHYVVVLIAATQVFAILFAQAFLDTATLVPRLHRALNAVIALPFIILAASALIDYTLSLQLIVSSMFPGVALVLGVGFRILMLNHRPARFFMAAWGIMLTAASISALKNLGVLPGNFFTHYALHIGSAIELVLLTLGLGDRITMMRREKEAAQAEKIEAQRIMVENLMGSHHELEEAYRRIARSEERYRNLVENSNDIIFTLDDAGTILSINRAVDRHFSVSPETVIGMHFKSLLFRGSAQPDPNRFVIEKIERFLRDREAVQFKAEFRSPIITEPKEMLVLLECVDIAGRDEMRGTATPITEDSLLAAMVEDRQVYRIGNYLLAAEDISHRMTRSLRRYLDLHAVTLVRVALREIIINAIEHGNLGITYDEKTNAITGGSYFEFVSSRQNDPRCRDRTVTVEHHITAERCTFSIADEGEGFDFRARMRTAIEDVNRQREVHGRGIIMASSIFDEIAYNEKGNQVTLVKHLTPVRQHSERAGATTTGV